MTTSECERIRSNKLLDAFYDEELDNEKIYNVFKHVVNCGSCRDELEDISKIAELLHRLPQLSPSSKLLLNIELSLQLREQEDQTTESCSNINYDSTFFADRSSTQSARCSTKLAVRRPSAVANQQLPATNQQPVHKSASPPKLLVIAAVAVLGFLSYLTTISRLMSSCNTKYSNYLIAEFFNSTSKDSKRQPVQHLCSSLNNEKASDLFELAPLFAYQTPTVTESLGIKTDKDGLYAIEM